MLTMPRDQATWLSTVHRCARRTADRGAERELTYDCGRSSSPNTAITRCSRPFRSSTGFSVPSSKRPARGNSALRCRSSTDGVRWAVAEKDRRPQARVHRRRLAAGGYAAMWGIAKDPVTIARDLDPPGSPSGAGQPDFGGTLRANLYRTQWKRMTPTSRRCRRSARISTGSRRRCC